MRIVALVAGAALLGGGATPKTWNELCLADKPTQARFIQTVNLPIDGVWTAERANACLSRYRIENGVVWAVENTCAPDCRGSAYYVQIQKVSPGNYEARGQYRRRDEVVYDRPVTVQVVDESTIVIIEKPWAGIQSARIFLKKSQIKDANLFNQDLVGAGGAALRTRLMQQESVMARCRADCGSVKDQCQADCFSNSMSQIASRSGNYPSLNFQLCAGACNDRLQACERSCDREE